MTASLVRRQRTLLTVQRRYEAQTRERSATTTHVEEILNFKGSVSQTPARKKKGRDFSTQKLAEELWHKGAHLFFFFFFFLKDGPLLADLRLWPQV